ncbi:DUF3054 domain-containing protein [Microbacterium murale]|uniref:Steroid 5-alpha reductase family enzyme n=1 Tax=Microbacterium murale TaxID=1081040 RepID=A0ABU0PCB1_9MICO|nr:DUF3054 domain-containing protein [Microbacterium murale]MDQ0644987.1 steroid 5-alpha reductase family enzyme [Microbacterium murale]
MTALRVPVALTIVIDVILVAVFCVIGRLSHAEGVFSDILGLVNTIWPFLVAVLAAHTVMLIRRAPADRMLPGVVIWAITVVVGLVLRSLSGQGTAVPFIIVATLTLALFLVGWRAVLALVRRVRDTARS